MSDDVIPRIVAVARTIKHCGDCGVAYWQPRTKTVYWMCADSDSADNGYTDQEECHRRFAAIAGVAHVDGESESPPQGAGWIEVYPRHQSLRDPAHDRALS